MGISSAAVGMRKLIRSMDKLVGTPSTLFLAFPSKLGRFLWNSPLTSGYHKVLATGLALLFIGTMGWVELHSPRGANVEFFYLLGCALVAWSAGIGGALICALASGVFLYLAEAREGGGAGWLFWCNSSVRLGTFAIISLLVAALARQARDREETVHQRTLRLQKEVEEHKETSELLLEAIQLSRQLTDHIADVFWVTDPLRNRVEYVSPGFEQLWGRSCSALYAVPSVWLEGIHHEERDRVMQSMITKQIRGDYDEEYRVVRPDGSIRWVHDRAFPVKSDDGAVYRIVGITEDITERKLTEQLVQAQREVGMALSSTGDVNYALERLLEIALQLEGVDCGAVYLMDAKTGELHLESHRGLSGAFLKRVSHYEADATETRMVRDGRIIYARQEQIPRNLEVLWGSEGLRALALVPVLHKGEPLGMLNLGSYSRNEIPLRTRVGIEMIASQVAGAIARIRAEESQRRSEAHVRTVINSAPIALLAVDANGLITFEDGEALTAMGLKSGERVGQLAAEVYQEFPLMLENIGKALRGEAFCSVLEFTATVFEYRFTPLPDKDKNPAGFIAVATDITERSRLQQEILEISDREKARIGRDVHDGLCQQLIGTAFSANSLEQSLTSKQLAEGTTARKVCQLLDEAIEESRRVCHGLYPVRLSTLGLQVSLEELAVAAQEKYGVQCVCEGAGERLDCDLATANHLYRIAQEALNNALKHSGARNISLRLGAAQEGILLEIRDDGRGVNRSEPSHLASSRSGGMGLHIMEYRAGLIGGTLQIESDSRGTLVTCRVSKSRDR